MYAQLNKTQKRTVKTYWIVWGIRELGASFFATTYVLFLLARGLNLFEANLVNVVFFATLFLFEIPTGVVADVWGRKISTVIAYGVTALSMGLYFFANSFLTCAIAEAVGAIGFTFLTGAFDAWVVDELKYHNYQGQVRWIFGRAQQIGKLASIAGSFIGAFMGSFNLALPWLGASVVLVVGGIYASVCMNEKSFQRRPYSFTSGWREMGTTFKTGIAYTRASKPMRFLIIMGIVQSFSVMAPNMQWTPWFKQLLGSTINLGFVWWGIALAIVLGAEFARAIAKGDSKQNEKLWLILSQIAIGVCIISTPLLQNVPLALVAFLMHESGRGLYKPLKDAYLNANIPSEQRATLLSFDAMAFHIGGVIGLATSGAIANAFGIPMAWVVSGSVLILGTLVIARNNNHTKNR